METDQVSTHSQNSVNRQHVYGRPSRNIVFYAQILIIVIVVVASIVNLSLNSTNHTELWVAVLSTSLGAVLPSPKLKPMKKASTHQSSTPSGTFVLS